MNTSLTSNNILSLRETAQLLTISLATLRRSIARGDGPTVVKLSARRIGVKQTDLHLWLAARSAHGKHGRISVANTERSSS